MSYIALNKLEFVYFSFLCLVFLFYFSCRTLWFLGLAIFCDRLTRLHRCRHLGCFVVLVSFFALVAFFYLFIPVLCICVLQWWVNYFDFMFAVLSWRANLYCFVLVILCCSVLIALPPALANCCAVRVSMFFFLLLVLVKSLVPLGLILQSFRNACGMLCEPKE